MKSLNEITTDLLVIGGGINGTGIAADAAGRGLSVALCEKDDLAAATSSASSKLIHGGLRYLELYDFKLVHEALKEREILLKKAPCLIRPLEFILPHDNHLRPVWQIQLGLLLYDHLIWHHSLPKSKKINLTPSNDQPLRHKFAVGFSYFDAHTDDARLVVTNALAAQQHGGKILTRTTCIKASRQNGHWLAELLCKNTNEKILVAAKAIANATGPWVNQVLQDVVSITSSYQIKLVKGSHFVVPKLYDGEHAYILQNNDQRIVFVIPYQLKFSLIGTTDILFSGDPNQVSISTDEINYLCEVVNNYFSKTISANDIVWSYAGVRPLFSTREQQPAKISREYYLELNENNNQAPILNVFGGKLTTFRKLAEDALAKLKPYFPQMGKPWTEFEPLPGGDLQGRSFAQFLTAMQQQYSWLPEEIVQRYVESYGSNINHLLADITCMEDLGEHFGAGLYEKEIKYLMKHEWAQTLDDIIWRRSKLGLFLTLKQKNELEHFISSFPKM